VEIRLAGPNFTVVGDAIMCSIFECPIAYRGSLPSHDRHDWYKSSKFKVQSSRLKVQGSSLLPNIRVLFRKKIPMTIQVKVKPKSKTARLDQLSDGTWVAKVKSPPVDGRANEELIRLVADHFGVPNQMYPSRAARRAVLS
jgi:hypothetical protein